MLNEIKTDVEQRMEKCLVSLQADFTKLRTGRAHPSLLEHLTVDYYGTETPLSQVANVAIGDPRTLTVTPWEKNMVAVIEIGLVLLSLYTFSVGEK